MYKRIFKILSVNDMWHVKRISSGLTETVIAFIREEKKDVHFNQLIYLSIIFNKWSQKISVVFIFIISRWQVVHHILANCSSTRWIRTTQRQTSRAIIDRCTNIACGTRNKIISDEDFYLWGGVQFSSGIDRESHPHAVSRWIIWLKQYPSSQKRCICIYNQ